jgi:hypothetical protein
MQRNHERQMTEQQRVNDERLVKLLEAMMPNEDPKLTAPGLTLVRSTTIPTVEKNADGTEKTVGAAGAGTGTGATTTTVQPILPNGLPNPEFTESKEAAAGIEFDKSVKTNPMQEGSPFPADGALSKLAMGR